MKRRIKRHSFSLCSFLVLCTFKTSYRSPIYVIVRGQLSLQGSSAHFVRRTTNTLTSSFASLAFAKCFWSSPRPISNSQLHTLLHFHLCPIYLIVSQGSYFLMDGISHLGGGFTLRCLQRLSLPDLATLPCRWSTTDTPVVRPARSSRTKASSFQISSARAG